MNWSDEQLKIYELAHHLLSCNEPQGLIVDAVAGSGKTTTIIEMVRRIIQYNSDQHLRIFLTSFGTKIVENLQSKAPFGVQCQTLNSFGAQLLRTNRCGGFVSQYKCYGLLQEAVAGFSPPKGEKLKLTTDENTLYRAYKKPVIAWVEILKAQGGWGAPVDLRLLADKYDLPYDPIILGYADKVLEMSAKAKTVDFNDQLCRPIERNLSMGLGYDMIVVDEAQDLSPVQIEMIKRIPARLKVFVGDARQAIYGFRGADTESFDNIERSLPSVSKATLSTSYRCPQAVLEKVQAIVPHFNIPYNAPDGSIEYVDSLPADLTEDDLIICRTNAPLIAEACRLAKQGRAVHVVGNGLEEMIGDILDQIQWGQSLEDWRKKQYGRSSSTLDDLEEAVRSLLSAGYTRSEDIKCLFSDVPGALQLMSIHRVKGLEAQRVIILRPDLMPHPKADKEWEHVQEQNIQYIAWTRSLCKTIIVNPEIEEKGDFEC